MREVLLIARHEYIKFVTRRGTLIGILLVPFVALAIVLFIVATFVLPLGMVVYGTIAAWETYQGKWYRYPWIADWIDRQMHTGFLATL